MTPRTRAGRPLTEAEPKHIVGLSGGKDSTAMALMLAEREPRDYEYICTPTGNEPAEMLEHWERLECLLGKPLTRITAASSLVQIIETENILPSHRMRWCTRRLKIEPTIAYIKANSPAILYVGLRADEDETARAGIYGGEVVSDFPLRRWGMTEDDVWDYLHHRGITIPTRTDCDWCYDQKLREWRRLYRTNREKYMQAVALEEKTGHTFRSPSRDTQPTKLIDLAAKFDSGFIPQGDSDQMELFEAPEFRKCRVCSL